MAADEGDMKAADEIADDQQDVAALRESFAQRLPRGLLGRAGRLVGRGDLLAVVHAERQHDNQEGERRQRQHGRPPVAEVALQDGRHRHDEELAERAAGRADADRQRLLLGRRYAQDNAQHRPEGRGRETDAHQHIAQDQHGAVVHGGGHDHAEDIEHAAAGDGGCGAETVGELAREGCHGAHQQHRQRRAEGEQLAPDIQFGRDRLQEDPKLWRTPSPMARMTKPHQTAVQ